MVYALHWSLPCQGIIISKNMVARWQPGLRNWGLIRIPGTLARKCRFKLFIWISVGYFEVNPFTTCRQAHVYASTLLPKNILTVSFFIFLMPLLHIRHKWQKIRAVQMYIEQLILPLPNHTEVMKGAFRLWKVRGLHGIIVHCKEMLC